MGTNAPERTTCIGSARLFIGVRRGRLGQPIGVYAYQCTCRLHAGKVA